VTPHVTVFLFINEFLFGDDDSGCTIACTDLQATPCAADFDFLNVFLKHIKRFVMVDGCC
jgi:hypothetical protein